ncbi:hypothetical protein Gpo141_00004182 [Globisporangium polare]
MDANEAPRTALPGFVSTAVLTSSDGLFGDNVEEKRISEAPAPNAQDASDYRPLYERLQELKDKKDSDWKEKHNPFAPPKALDDEEFQFIRDLEERQAESQQRRKEQHNEDVAEFLLAKQQTSASATATAITTSGPMVGAALSEEAVQKYLNSKKQAAPVVVRAKRKAAPKDKAMTAASVVTTTKKQKATATVEEEKPKSAAASASKPSIGLVAYGSDSDDSD